MSVLKNKRRTSKIEYERNFLGFYEYMNGRIDNMPRRWMKPLGLPMKEVPRIKREDHQDTGQERDRPDAEKNEEVLPDGRKDKDNQR